MKFRNKDTGITITEEELKELQKREYENYLTKTDEPFSFQRFCEEDTSFEVVEE